MNELNSEFDDPTNVGFDAQPPSPPPPATPKEEQGKKKKKKGKSSKNKKKKKDDKERDKGDGDKNFIFRSGSKKKDAKKKGIPVKEVKDEDKLYSFSLGDLDNAESTLPSRRASLALILEKKAEEEEDANEVDSSQLTSPMGKRQLFGRKLSFFNKQPNSGPSSPRSQDIATSTVSRLRLALPLKDDQR